MDLALVRKETKRLIVTAQHMDGLLPGRGMGHVLPDALVNAGIQAVFLNHAECPLTLSQLAKAMARGDELGILTIVCADTVEEAMAIAKLHPDIMVCEPTSLIGTGQVSDEKFMKDTNEAVKALSPTRWFCRQQESVRQKMYIGRLYWELTEPGRPAASWQRKILLQPWRK